MNKITRRMLTSITTLVLTVIALGTTTFAWFSLSDISSITGIEANVMTGDGLEVMLHWKQGAVDHSSGFKNHLDTADWTSFFTAIEALNDDKAFVFGAVSTTDALAFTELTQTPLGHLKIADVVGGANTKYLEFNLTFRSLQGGSALLNKIDFDGTTTGWGPADMNPYDQGDANISAHQVTATAMNAARVGFIHNGSLLGFDGKDAVFENDGADYAFGGSVVTGNKAGQDTGIVTGQYDYLTTSRNLKIYDKNDNQILDPTDIAIIAASEISELGAEVVTIPLALNDAETYYEATVTVRIWLEGWDADLYDSIYGTNLIVDMVFNKLGA